MNPLYKYVFKKKKKEKKNSNTLLTTHIKINIKS